MKRMFIAAMAIAALVSCSKDNEDTILTSSKKSVSITIENAVSSRAVVDAATSVVMDEEGSVGDVFDAGANVVSAEYTELEFLFANTNGEIVEIHTPADAQVASDNVHTLQFHRVTEAATQIAVVRYGDMTELKVGDNLADIRDEAASEAANKEVELNMITLYGASGLTPANDTCEVDGVNYNLYTASVNLAPMFARFEISGIECTDLGEATYGMATNTIDPTVAVKGYDELTLNDITFGTSQQYTYEFAEGTKLYGKYDPSATNKTRTDFADARVLVFDETVNEAIAATGAYTGTYKDDANAATTMLAWNIAPQAAPSGEGENIQNPLVLSVDTHAYDFTNADKTTTLTVRSLGVDNFAAGNIYRLYLAFSEANLDNYNDGICVNVTVTVAKWVVNIVEPTFKTEPAEAPAE